MSCPSEFIILRRNYISTEQEDTFIEGKQLEWKKTQLISYLKSEDELKDVITPNFIKLDEFGEYISVNDKHIYIDIMNMHFLTEFSVLKDEFNLYSNSNAGQVEIDINTANELLTAVNYLLGKNYSDQFEIILNNYYVKLLGELLPSYQYRNSSNSIDYEDAEFERSGIYYLKKMQAILQAYIWMEKENTCKEYVYKLIYMI
jgi:hypothetical protein